MDPAYVLEQIKLERTGARIPYDPKTRYKMPPQFIGNTGKAAKRARKLMSQLKDYDASALYQHAGARFTQIRDQAKDDQDSLDEACEAEGVQTYDFFGMFPADNFAEYYNPDRDNGDVELDQDQNKIYQKALADYQARQKLIDENTLELPADQIPKLVVPEHLPDPESYREQYTREVREELSLADEIDSGLRDSHSLIQTLNYQYEPTDTYYDNQKSANQHDPRKLAVSVYTSPAYRRINAIMNYGIFGRWQSPQDLADAGETPYESYDLDKNTPVAVERSLHFIRITARILLDSLQDWGDLSSADLSQNARDDLNRRGAVTRLVARGEKKKDSAANGDYTLNKLTSTSKSMKVAKKYYKTQVKDAGYDNSSITIFALKGYNGVDIEGLSNNTSTEQILLPKGTRMRIRRAWTPYINLLRVTEAFNNGDADQLMTLEPDADAFAKEERRYRSAEDKDYSYIGLTFAEELPPEGKAAIKKEEIRSSMDRNTPKGKRYGKMLDSLYYARDMLRKAKA